MTQIEKSAQSKLQMAEFNKRFSRMTRIMWATNLMSTDPKDLFRGWLICLQDNAIS